MKSSTSPSSLRAAVKKKLRQAGLDWSNFDRAAEQMIVFGSRAVGETTPKSDLDLLCVGSGKPYQSHDLHILWIPKSRLNSRRWLGSELATHIAAHGLWIKGKNNWAISSRPSDETIKRKMGRIIARSDALRIFWDELLPVYREHQLRRLRRDVQRLILMRQGLSALPAPSLDSEWCGNQRRESWKNLLQQAPDVAPHVQKVIAMVKS